MHRRPRHWLSSGVLPMHRRPPSLVEYRRASLPRIETPAPQQHSLSHVE